MTIIKVFFNNFWAGFENGKDPVSFIFFKLLFQKVYNTVDVSISSLEEANVLVESPWVNNSFIPLKKWRNTYLFSGESYLNHNYNKYDCVLFGKQTQQNFVNVPLYIPYIISSHGEDFILKNESLSVKNVPKKDVVVFI